MKVGSKQWFDANTKELSSIRKLTEESSKNKVHKLIISFVAWVRKKKKDTYIKDLGDRSKALRAKLEPDSKRFQETIDGYVKSRGNDLKEKAFQGFKTLIQPVFKAADDLSKPQYVSDLKAHRDLLDALNDLRGGIKVNALAALKNLPEILNNYQPQDPASPFDTLVATFKQALEQAKPLIEANLPDMEKAMGWDYQGVASFGGAVLQFLSPDAQKELDQFSSIREWATKMKGQRTEAIRLIPTGNFSFSFKFYGYEIDKMNAAEKFSNRLMDEIDGAEKLDRALATYINELAMQKANEIAADVGPYINNKGLLLHPDLPIKQAKIEIAKCEKEIEKLKTAISDNPNSPQTAIRIANFKIYGTNRDLYKKRVKCYRNHWNVTIRPHLDKLNQKKEEIANVAKKSGRVKTSEAHTLLSFQKELDDIAKDLAVAKQIYSIKCNWELLKLDSEAYPNQLESNAKIADCTNIIDDCTKNLSTIDEILKLSGQVNPKDRDIDWDARMGEIQTLKGVNEADKKAAEARKACLTEIDALTKTVPSNTQEVNAVVGYQIIPGGTGPDGLFAAISHHPFDPPQPIAVDAIRLRHEVYDYLQKSPDLIAEALFNDILAYAEEKDPKNHLNRIDPEWQLLYHSFRQEYLASDPGQKQVMSDQLKSECPPLVDRYITSRREGKTYPDQLEVHALEVMLGRRILFHPNAAQEAINLLKNSAGTRVDYLKKI